MTNAAGRRGSLLKRVLVGVAVVLTIAVLVALGMWQIERRAWKLDLISRVEARVNAPALPPPPRSEWPNVTAANSEYRHVTATGTFLHDKETLVYAATELGAGAWVITPLILDDGTAVLVNRGFVPTEKHSPASRPEALGTAPARVTGLLRISEPGGTLLRSNDPASDRWYSRDVAAIGEQRNISNLAPYFIDADATPNPGRWPVGGLTRISFPNNHLVYIFTWFGLAALLAGASLYVGFLRRQDDPGED
ncbi:SURF1 family protein [Phyllobacterium sp. 0TCS1.6C]|uniref:SURF1 family protein n=1 Tax=unclassified Phyllobacterium TaxID=2638441 RepID=UPI002264D7D7|nr:MULTISPECIES: SURF1 family protein [unclassified Phyllobacterium]MCX8279984.1 SURF1 family protein [Phyllobacterium sp. 0TCS1.6C]MCX8296151.1 SURF1 family protein [Phyllobacterium sp. 0TCS1.6A]